MSILKTKKGFLVNIDGSVVDFWLDEKGLHTKRTTSVENRIIHNEEQILSFSDVLAKSENQLTLPV